MNREVFYFFLVSLFKSFSPPIEAGCKGKALFSAFTRTFEIYFLEVCLADKASNTCIVAVKFLTGQISVGAVALAEPVVRLTIWDCKSSGIFWVCNKLSEALGLRGCKWTSLGVMGF